MRSMEFRDPAGCIGHRFGLTYCPFPNDVAHPNTAIYIFEKQGKVAGARVSVCAQTPWSKAWQRLKQVLIDFDLVGNIAAVSVRIMALPNLIFDKHAPVAALRSLKGETLVGKGTS